MSAAQLNDHPYRAAIMEEVHARPVEIIRDYCRVRRVVVAMPNQAGSMMSAFAHFNQFCEDAGVEVPLPTTRQHSFDTPDRHVTWEFHTEFITVTWRSASNDSENWPTDIGLEILTEGSIIGAMRLDLISDRHIPDRLVPGFNLASLCLADIENGKGQVAVDFVPDEDKFTRFEVAVGGLTILRRSIIVRRLMEIETYRNMALLGLPLARASNPELRTLELELSEVVEGLSKANSADAVQASLTSLHALSVRSGQLSERLGYRFAAGHAYGDVLRMRLAGIRENSTTRGSTLTHYIGNRVEPGLATCAAMEKRLSVLAEKIERAIGMLNVRIGVDMQLQNGAVLDSIAKTARSQFLLQRTVEGLSVIAISYYLLGIIGYAMAGPLTVLHWDKTMSLSIAAPFVLLFVWVMVRAIRKSHSKH
jgi:uncharacterized membrane-anchored protein